DERQADAFGFRYAKNSGWDPRALEGVFDTLGRVSAASGGGGMPAWASTHPAPANRSELIRQQVAAEGLGEGQLRVDRDGYLQRLDGMVYGADPRQGFFREGMFYHPQMAFQMRFPQGWPTQNSRQAVVGINPDRNAMVQLSLRREETVQAAAQAFFQQQGVERGQRWDGMRHDPSLAYAFQARDAQGVPQLGGIVSFLEQGDVILQLIGYGRTDTLRGAAPALRQTLASFAQLRDRRLLSVEPMRLEVQRARSGTSLQAVARNASIDAADLELINAMDGGGSFPSGSLFKTVRGFNPARN
ncbi:MAG: M48 family metalloprotease, partial [Acidobacteriota bacterium]